MKCQPKPQRQDIEGVSVPTTVNTVVGRLGVSSEAEVRLAVMEERLRVVTVALAITGRS